MDLSHINMDAFAQAAFSLILQVTPVLVTALNQPMERKEFVLLVLKIVKIATKIPSN